MNSNCQYEQTSVAVIIAVAVNTNGRVDCRIADSVFGDDKREYETWLKELKADRVLWSIKRVKVHVPYPESYEDLTKV